MKLIDKTLLTASALLLFAAAPTVYAVQPTASTDDPAAYIAGTKAMNEHRWKDAVGSFDQVINARQKKADAALYWKAYSLNKLGNSPLALATCFQLHSQYTDSSWNKDCEALGIDVNGYAGAFPPVPPVPPVPPMAPLPPLTKTMTMTMSRIDRDYDRESRDPAPTSRCSPSTRCSTRTRPAPSPCSVASSPPPTRRPT